MIHPIIPFMARIKNAKIDDLLDLFATEINNQDGNHSFTNGNRSRISLHGVIVVEAGDRAAMIEWRKLAALHPQYLHHNKHTLAAE